jgi:response regulator RpfG family c-di-GMP phosphodiesterase
LELPKSTLKVICIDHDKYLALMVKQVLNYHLGPENVVVYEVESSEAGLEKMSHEGADMVFCEIELPGTNGFEICRRIKNINPQTSVILTTVYSAERDHASEALKAGADFFIAKPVKKGEFLFAIQSILQNSNLKKAVHEKKHQLENALGKLKEFHGKITLLSQNTDSDKKLLGTSLQQMVDLNSQLEDKNLQISKMVEEMSSRFNSTETLLVDIIELRQSGHRGHCERVAEMSTFIARKMDLTDFQVQNIKTAARLHELGIIALPTQEKRDEAAEAEQGRVASTHPLVGEMLLKGYPGFEVVADIIRHLHENVDGSGSPDKLIGERIPIGSRIISAASFFDHSRVVDPAKPLLAIMERMDEEAGAVFDDLVLQYLGDYIQSQEEKSGRDQFMECSVFGLAEGMELATDLYTESGINLLRKGTVLSQEIINKVLRFHNVDPITGNIKIKLAS